MMTSHEREAEKSPLLEAVARQLLVLTQQPVSELWRVVVTL
jgi:hypothetical protein